MTTAAKEGAHFAVWPDTGFILDCRGWFRAPAFPIYYVFQRWKLIPLSARINRGLPPLLASCSARLW